MRLCALRMGYVNRSVVLFVPVCLVLLCWCWGPSLQPCACLSSTLLLSCTSLKTLSIVFSFQLQVNLLSKFLLIAKSCYEQRNFATAMQILGGLEHLAVRQSPVRHMGLRGLRGWASTQGHKGLTCASLSGLENPACEDC